MKLDVLDTCAKASLIYGCETWGNNMNDAERSFTVGLKTALNVWQNLNNEVVHIETGRWPLRIRVKSLQLKFWLQMKVYISEHPESALAKVYNMGLQSKSPYLSYYLKLESEFGDPATCEKSLTEATLESYKEKITSQFNIDHDSRLGTYYRINPTLTSNVPVP